MIDNGNINIFAGAPDRFLDALPLFAGVQGTAIPVRPESAGEAVFYTVAGIDEGGRQTLAAFTSETLVAPPFIRRSLPDTALLFFHSPCGEAFIFNPRHPQSIGEAAPLRASRADMSRLAGFAKSGAAAAGGDAARLADGELGLGNLHSAHYLYALAAARNPASRAGLRMCAAMIELELLQEAYDLLKSDWDPEAKMLLAVILRKTGSLAEARNTLDGLAGAATLAERRALEYAWLDLEEGREEEARKAFQRLSASAFDKTEALSGLGAALARTAFRAKDKGRLAEAAQALSSALVTPSPLSARIFLQLGNLYFRSGEYAKAEPCYRRSAALAPSVQALANLALALLRTGKHAEAAAVTAQVALTDLAAAKRLAGEFPKGRAAEFFRPQEQTATVPEPDRPKPAAPPAPAATPPAPQRPDSFRRTEAPPEPPTPPAPAAAAFKPPAPPGRPADASIPIHPAFLSKSGRESAQKPAEEVSLAPARPKDASASGRSRPETLPEQRPEVKIETLRDVMAGSGPTEEESRRDDFISGAFRLASDLEDELGRKIYFNLDGLSEAEKHLRLQFIKTKTSAQGNVNMVRNCAAFLCYFLQERHKGRLLKFPDFDPWGWPMVFEIPGHKFISYPVQRVWRLLWEDTVPEPGWLAKYAAWISDKMKETSPPVCGAAAVRIKAMSHAERLADAQTEHKRMMVLVSSLDETSHIEIGRSGVTKIEQAIKASFKPDIPPTSDGWKLLRCYGHLFAAILAKDLKAAWYNVDGEDGGWSMRMPWNTFVFPLGKIYKTASSRGDLGAYYDALLSEKLRYQ